jgi:hypothetical protein
MHTPAAQPLDPWHALPSQHGCIGPPHATHAEPIASQIVPAVHALPS